MLCCFEGSSKKYLSYVNIYIYIYIYIYKVGDIQQSIDLAVRADAMYSLLWGRKTIIDRVTSSDPWVHNSCQSPNSVIFRVLSAATRKTRFEPYLKKSDGIQVFQCISMKINNFKEILFFYRI